MCQTEKIIAFLTIVSAIFFYNENAVANNNKPLSSVGQYMREKGITPRLSFGNLTMENLNTGTKHYQVGNSGDIFAGADFDMDKLVGFKNGTVHIDYTFFIFDRETGFPTDNTWQGRAGSYMGGLPIHNDVSGGYLTNLTYEQQLFDNRISITVGRSNPNFYYFWSNCESIINCVNPVANSSPGHLPPPYGSWMGYIKFKATKHNYLHAGGFESNPASFLAKEHGFHFSTRKSAGITWLGGIGHQESYAETKLANHYELNYFYNTDSVTHQLHPEEQRRGNGGLMLNFQQALWRKDEVFSDSPRALQLFGSWHWAASNWQPFRQFAELGLSYLSPFYRRKDRANIKISYAQMNKDQRDYQRVMRVANHGVDQSEYRDIFRAEINYHLALSDNVFIEPSIQYIYHPDNYYDPSAAKINKSGYVVGLQIMWDIGNTLGL